MSAAFGLAVLLAAAPPPVENARVTERAVTAGLAAAVRQALRESAAPQWIAYRVPIAAGRQTCCWDSGARDGCCRGCRLEGGRGFVSGRETAARLEDDATGIVYLRGEGGRVNRIRFFSGSCPVDGGGLPLTWLTGVAPVDSLHLLASWAEEAEDRDGKSVAEGALAAIAFHDDPAADRHLIRLARRHPASRTRGQALFWLSQKAGEKAAAAITGAIDDDPDADVKEKAVFALSQLPKDEGVPRLIEVARTHRSREVRKKAMFWLGQSNDPRALGFIEDVLTR